MKASPKRLALALALILAGCGINPAPTTTAAAQPLTPREMLVSAETSYTAAVDALNNVVAAGGVPQSVLRDILSADHMAGAALDNADAMLAAYEQAPTPDNQANLQKALQIAQTSVGSLLVILQQQQAPAPAPGAK